MTTITRISTLLVTIVLLAAVAGPAEAKKKPDHTGVFAGELTTVAPGSDIEYEEDLVVTVARLKGVERVAGLAARVRTYCDSGVLDIPVNGAGRPGPRVDSNGRFTVKREGVVIAGQVRGRTLTGTVSASRDGCSLASTSFALKKRVF